MAILAAGDADIKLLHMVFDHLEVRVVLRPQLSQRQHVAVDGLRPALGKPKLRILERHPVLLEGEADFGVMLQAEFGEILDTRVRQERRRHGKQIGLTRLEDRLGLVLLRRQIPVLDDLGATNGGNR